MEPSITQLACLALFLYRGHSFASAWDQLCLPMESPIVRRRIEIVHLLLGSLRERVSSGQLPMPRVLNQHLISSRKFVLELAAIGDQHLAQSAKQLGVSDREVQDCWGEPQWRTMWFLLLFLKQLEHNAKKCLQGARVIHVDAHCLVLLALALAPSGDTGLSAAVWKALAPDIPTHVQARLETAFVSLRATGDFARTLLACSPKSLGVRACLKRMEILDRAVVTCDMPVHRSLSCAHAAVTPQTALLQQSAPDNPRRTTPTRKTAVAPPGKISASNGLSEAEVVQLLLVPPTTPEASAPFILQEHVSASPQLPAQLPAARPPQARPRQTQAANGSNQTCLIDLFGLCGFILVMGLLLFWVKPDTYELGVAWWHFILGVAVTGTGMLGIFPVLKAWIVGARLELG